MIHRNLPRALGALAILAAAFAVTAAGAVPAIGAQLQNVFVKNDIENPVPTAAQGVTQVAGTVGVDDSTPIAVAPVEVPTERIVQFTRTFTLAAGENQLVQPLYDVPEGKRLIIDRVTASLFGPDATSFAMSLGEKTGPQYMLPTVLVPNQSDQIDRYAVSEVGPFYVDDGFADDDELVARIVVGTAGDLSTLQSFTINGRIVDL